MNDNTVPEAISLYVKGLSLMPSNFQAYIDLGNLYLKIGNTVNAVSEFERALRLNPDAQYLRAQIEQLKQGR